MKHQTWNLLFLGILVIFIQQIDGHSRPQSTPKMTTKRTSRRRSHRFIEPAVQPPMTSQPTHPTRRPATTNGKNNTNKNTGNNKGSNGKNNNPRGRNNGNQRMNELKNHPLFNASATEVVDSLRKNLKNMNYKDKQSLQNYITNASVVLAKGSNKAKDKTKNKNDTDSIEVVKILEEFGTHLSQQLQKTIFENETEVEVQISSYYFVFGVKVVKKQYFTGYIFPDVSNLNNRSIGAENQKIRLPKEIFNFTEIGNDSYSSIISMSYLPVQAMRENALNNNVTVGTDNILSTSINPPLERKLDKNNRISITLQKSEVKIYTSSAECVYWNYTSNDNTGGWSNEGCEEDKKNSNATHVVCLCNHLTDFSILLSLQDIPVNAQHRLALGLITKIGCSLSIAFLLVTILIIVSIRELREKQRYILHTNLAVALIIANLAFLISEAVKDNEDGCLTISIITFYFYLAAFFWMLCEGIYIWRAVVSVFMDEDKTVIYVFIGWGLPAIIVIVTSALKHEQMISESACWLSIKDWVILSFAVPALLIILINVIILIVVLRIAQAQAQKMEKDSIISMARLTMLLLPLLGATWIFGVLAINEDTLAFKYIFTIFNSLQGFFIFLCYVVLSKEVRKEMRKHGPFKYSLGAPTLAQNNPTYASSVSNKRKSTSISSMTGKY